MTTECDTDNKVGQDNLEEFICFFSSSTSSGTIQHWALSGWSHKEGKAAVILRGLAKINHPADEWRHCQGGSFLLCTWQSLVAQSLVIFSSMFFIPLPPLHAFGFWKPIYAKWLLVLVLVGGWGGHLFPWLCGILSVPWVEKCHLAIPYPHQGNFLSFL